MSKGRRHPPALCCNQHLGWSPPYPPIHPDSSPTLSHLGTNRGVVDGSGKQATAVKRTESCFCGTNGRVIKPVKLTPTRAQQPRGESVSALLQKKDGCPPHLAVPSLFFNFPTTRCQHAPEATPRCYFPCPPRPHAPTLRQCCCSCIPAAAGCGAASFAPPALLCLLRLWAGTNEYRRRHPATPLFCPSICRFARRNLLALFRRLAC